MSPSGKLQAAVRALQPVTIRVGKTFLPLRLLQEVIPFFDLKCVSSSIWKTHNYNVTLLGLLVNYENMCYLN